MDKSDSYLQKKGCVINVVIIDKEIVAVKLFTFTLLMI
jgi:hypothetical protein